MAKAAITKTELVCEKCGERHIKFEIYKTVLYCSFCLEAVKRKERFDKEEKEWDNAK